MYCLYLNTQSFIPFIHLLNTNYGSLSDTLYLPIGKKEAPQFLLNTHVTHTKNDIMKKNLKSGKLCERDTAILFRRKWNGEVREWKNLKENEYSKM